MNRPALKELLSDCENGLVDIVIVYKVDRLSRSIVDFGELSKKFDTWAVGFVSVTQEINTSTSSGRMMLNILMTFAQYEREVIAERVRDKMSASRKRGQWGGGTPPYGYRVQEKKLVVIPEEVERVRWVFQRFIEIQSPKMIAAELNASGVKTHQNRKWNKGHIYRMLNNHTYIGEVNYKGHICKGEQMGIIDRRSWNRVREIISGNTHVKEFKGKVEIIAPLKGAMRCGHCGGAMSPTYTVKDKKKYYYYICAKDDKRSEKICPLKRVPAGDIEKIVMNKISELLSNPEIVSSVASKAGCSALTMTQFFRSQMWDGMSAAEQNRLVNLLVEEITVWKDSIDFEFKTKGLKFLMEDVQYAQNANA